MPNKLEAVIHEIVAKHNIMNEKDFSSVLIECESYIPRIQEAASSNGWVFFSQATYDGWYCIETAQNPAVYAVYYKECGAIAWGCNTFAIQGEAVASVIYQSGYLKVAHNTDNT